jgi:hypothetical protein
MDMRSATVCFPSRMSCALSACDEERVGCWGRYFLKVVRDQRLETSAASLCTSNSLTVASEWFSFTPRASRRCARRPSCEMTSLSSCYEMSRVQHDRHDVTHLPGTQLHDKKDKTKLRVCTSLHNSASTILQLQAAYSLHLFRYIAGLAAIKTRADKEPAAPPHHLVLITDHVSTRNTAIQTSRAPACSSYSGVNDLMASMTSKLLAHLSERTGRSSASFDAAPPASRPPKPPSVDRGVSLSPGYTHRLMCSFLSSSHYISRHIATMHRSFSDTLPVCHSRL